MEASKIFAAVSAYFMQRGYACLPEFTLKTNRRADITCLGRDNDIIIIEVKSSVTDFKTDKKWQDYIAWADAFYFAVDESFPLEILPDEETCGILITDGFDCHMIRKAPIKKLAGMRRTHLVRRLARAAMMRLYYQDKP